MSIKINSDKCVGCTKCKDVCPGNLIYMDENNKAYIKYPKDCWGCTSCIKECSVQAIDFFIGSDIGGLGSVCHTKNNGDTLEWILVDSKGEKTVTKINKNNANAY